MTCAELSIVCQTTCSGRDPTSSRQVAGISPGVLVMLGASVRGGIILNRHHSENKGTSNSLFQRKIPGRGLGNKSKNKAAGQKETERKRQRGGEKKRERKRELCLVLFPFDICYILPENNLKAPLTGFLLVGWRC